MKKLGLISVAALMSFSAFAEGYQVNMLSTKQSGMGHVGVAMKLGAESMHFNPAGMAFMDGVADISVGVSGVHSEAKWSYDGQSHRTDNTLSTPMYAYAAFRIYDNLKAGISLTTPYGNGIDWGKNWAGAALVQKIDLKAFSIQPTISYRLLDNLSVGVGMMIAFGNVNLEKGLVGPNKDGVVPVAVKLAGDSKVRLGVNAGVLWDITDQWSFGVSYRSKILMKVNRGDASVEYPVESTKPLYSSLFNDMNQATFRSELPLPANLTAGLTYRPTQKLELAFDWQWVHWSAYETLKVTFNESSLAKFNQVLDKNYENTMIFRLGAQYAVTNRFDLRAGVYYDQSPVQSDFYNPETPGMDKLGTSVGFSFRPFKGFSIDFATTYIAGFSRNGTYPNSGSLDPTPFKGHYKTWAVAPSFGLSYTF